jgi:glycosyltransferase involved in cell wall biosynthesis
MNKKILVCAYSCVSESGVKNIGGEAELGWNLVKELSRFFDVFVLTHSHNQKSIEELLLKNNLNNLKFIYIKLPLFLNFLEQFHKGGIQIYAYLWQVKAYFVAKKLHKENKFDAFHHVTYANDWMASFIGALLPIPYIRGPGGGAHKVPKEFVKEYSLKQKIAEKVRSIGQWIFRHDLFFIIGQKRARALLVCNYEAKNIIPKKWQNKVYLFPVNGISFNDLPVTREKKENNQFVVLTAGKLIKIKSFDLAIKAFKIFNDKFPNSKLIIAGEGPERNNLENLANSLNIKEKVIFDGWVKRKELLEKMNNCDVFLFPSLRDGGGNVVVEAMAVGRPVICFDLAGPGFHIDQSCGIKIKANNPKQAIEDMAKALERLYLDKDLRLKLGQGAREKAEKEYDWDKLGDRMFDIYIATLNYKKVL